MSAQPSIEVISKDIEKPVAGAQVSVGGQVKRPGAVAFRNGMTLIQLAILGVVSLLLGLFVLRPILTRSQDAAALPAPDEMLDDGVEPASSIDGSLAIAGEVIEAGPVASERLADLRQIAVDRQSEATALLASWLESSDAPKEPA